MRTYFLRDPSYTNQEKKDEKEENSLLQGDIDDFMAWGFFFKRIHELVDWEREEMKVMYDIMAKDYGVSFKPGKTPGIKACLMNVDEVNALWRPLLVYVMFFFVNSSGRLWMRYCGFQFFLTKNGLGYWYRPERSRNNEDKSFDSSKQLPLLFFHGISPGGLTIYLPMLLYGMSSSGRAAFYFENPPITCALSFKALTEEETCNGVLEALNTHLHKDKKVIIAGHSFGSCQISWLLHSPVSQRIHQLLLLDPVSILLCYPDTMQNFLYKFLLENPITMNFQDQCVRYMVSTEIGVEHYLRRRVAWYNSELFFETVPDSIQVTVCLSGKDNIVNASSVKKEVVLTNEIRLKSLRQNCGNIENGKVKTRQVELIYWPEDGHGQCLFMRRSWNDLEKSITRQDHVYSKSLKLS